MDDVRWEMERGSCDIPILEHMDEKSGWLTNYSYIFKCLVFIIKKEMIKRV